MGKKYVAVVFLLTSLLLATASAAESQDQTEVKKTDAKKSEAKSEDMSWRFNMTQNGKQMTADQFDAWMKKRGVRVATGKPAAPKGGAQVKKAADE